VDGEEVILYRALKRSKTGVVQDAGYIFRNGLKEDKTAQELKQIVLDLLNYPKDLLTKNKALIYRYTVYTPQEEMKQILLGKKEERLDTLRKVFGIDKYKQIRDNATVVVKHIRGKKREYDGAVADLPSKVLEKEKKVEENLVLNEKLAELKPKLELKKVEWDKRKEELQSLEAKKEELVQVKNELAVNETELKHKLKEKVDDEERIKLLREEVEKLSQENLEVVEDVMEKVKVLDEEIAKHESKVREALNKIQEFRTKQSHSKLIKDKVESLNNCPTCFQEVSEEYKKKVVDKSLNEIEEFSKNISSHEEERKALDMALQEYRMKVQLLKRKESDQKVIVLKKRQLESKKEELVQLEEKAKSVKQRIGQVNLKIMECNTKLEALSSVEELLPKLLTAVENAEKEFRVIEPEIHRVEATLEAVKGIILSLEQEIVKKQTMMVKKEYLNKVQFWLTDYFVPMIEAMEKNIMLKVHTEFNSLFEKWFSILIDNQTLQMSLDEEYSPKILQDGYDIDYQHLSGGEKTAGALAYRLALNQIINKINAGIKTKDLLILDEPTDGFSHEQLDRLRILMDEINIPQIIMVSHEPQIESFVDSTIKFEKVDHVTKIV